MKVYFAHGKESGPWGSKIKRLSRIAENFGHQIESIDYSDLVDPDERVKRLLVTLEAESQDCILVGSSMGGYVSLVASMTVKVRAIFLLAPALAIPNYKIQTYRSLCASNAIEIVHGWCDTIIPIEHSIRFAKAADCSLHLIEGDHRLNSSLQEVEALFSNFLAKLN